MNKRAEPGAVSTASLEQSAFWMPFTANRQFKKTPRLLARAEGMYYWTPEGRQILDGTSGLWCVNAGHCRPKIVQAVQRQVAEMDFAPTFNMGHPAAFEFAERLAQIAPPGFSRVFFTNSGSESADTALKIALAYHRARGEAGRYRLIGRERGYHGVNFGGMAVGGITANKKMFGPGVAGVDHIRHTHDPARNAFSKGQPKHGVEFADELERLCVLHDPSTIAAVIVEPVAGSTGVLIPPKGYLKRLRELCTKHGILLIFDEVITGFGRLATPFAFGAVQAWAYTAMEVVIFALVIVWMAKRAILAKQHGLGEHLFHGLARPIGVPPRRLVEHLPQEHEILGRRGTDVHSRMLTQPACQTVSVSRFGVPRTSIGTLVSTTRSS